jgi:hypothetical protein
MKASGVGPTGPRFQELCPEPANLVQQPHASGKTVVEIHCPGLPFFSRKGTQSRYWLCLLYEPLNSSTWSRRMNVKVGIEQAPAYGSPECDYDTKDQATDDCIKLQRCAGHLMGRPLRERCFGVCLSRHDAVGSPRPRTGRQCRMSGATATSPSTSASWHVT